ncbi:MAG: hypothetical protein EA392_01540 [Cryomorphaceae bacterium]|nr:MAG: hypothetical protein EA392_01540 [Cryomorphaceae bacterium]
MAKQTTKVKVEADNRSLKRGLKDSERDVQGFGSKVEGLAKKLKMLAGAAAIGAVVKGLVDMAKQVGKTADRLLDLEQITGISTDRLQEYEHVARVAGVNSEAMANAVMGLTQRLARGAEMSAGLRMGIEALNISVHDSSGNLRDLGIVTEEAIVALSEMQDITQRNVIGAQLFSGAWKDLAPILALGKDGIEAAKNEARELGLVMSKESLEAANAFRVEMETLNAQWSVMKNNIGLAVIPALSALIQYINSLRRGYSDFLELIGTRPPKIDFDSVQIERDVKDTVDAIIEQFAGAGERSGEDFIKEYQRIIDNEGKKIRMPVPERGAFPSGRDGSRMFALAVAEAERYNSVIEQTIAYAHQQIASIQQQADELEKVNEENQTLLQTEQQRRDSLGDIGRLQEDLAKAEAAFIAANTDAERERFTRRIAQLKTEIELIKERASLEAQGGREADRRGLTGISPIAPMGIATDTAHQEWLDQQAEKTIALKKLTEQAQSTGQALLNMEGFAVDAAYNAGVAMGNMAAEGGKATQQIIKQMMAQTIAALIRHIMTQVPFPANLALAAGAGVMASGLFSQIPAYEKGTNFHGGGLALVGEAGPEIVNLPRGSQVHTNRESMGMMGAGGRVEFEIKGDRLVGVLQRYSSRLNSST